MYVADGFCQGGQSRPPLLMLVSGLKMLQSTSITFPALASTL